MTYTTEYFVICLLMWGAVCFTVGWGIGYYMRKADDYEDRVYSPVKDGKQ